MAEENKQIKQEGEKKEEKNVPMAIIAYLFFVIPLLTDKRTDPFVKYHVKQGITIFVSGFIILVIGSIPVVGPILFTLGLIILFLIWLIGILNAAASKKEPAPLIGKFGEKIKF